jgi:isopenicillin N synthase-like dioxygenase
MLARQGFDFDVRTLATLGYVTLPYPEWLRPHVQAAMGSWKQFCELPIGDKLKFSGGDRVQDFGYMLRKDEGDKADSKELFHALRANSPHLLHIAEKIGDARATDFISAVDDLIKGMEGVVQQFARDVTYHFGLSKYEHEVMSSRNNWVFRYLHYLPGARPDLANAHADRGNGFTFHLGETEEGGEYLGFDRAWRPWPVSRAQTIIFPGIGLQYRSQGTLQALWHQVVSNGITAANGRYSMVAFIDSALPVRFNDKKFRMQSLAPGFNYGLSHEELTKYFVPC